MNKNIRVFVISAEQNTIDVTRGALKYLGYNNISVVNNPANAPGYILREKGHMVISDFSTLMDGKPPLLQILKSNPELKRLIIISLVERTNVAKEIKQMYKEGVSSLLLFPFKMSDLQKAINDAMRNATDSVQDTFGKIRKLDFFSFMTDEEMLKLLKMCKCRNYKKDDVIFEEGQAGDRFYVVIEGKVGIYKGLAYGESEQLATIKEGEFFGEMAILDNSPRSANAISETDTLMFEMDEKVMEGYDDIITLKVFKKITFALSERLSDSNRKIKELSIYENE
ncbi:MAG: cyclic nucleotide-binding domain-containing protein [Candidatus Magnetoovum sp. WYHC-5]|nr:cyclic nucleotide-binding domain-containing protein [Candidatus Magnetoovum sp. WYHC-5]